MAGLVLEGGTFRPIFSAGVMDALLENNIMFPYCIGVSAGISNGVSYISKQPRRNLKILEEYRNDKRYIGVNNFIKNKSLFGIDFLFDEVPNNLIPFDMKTYMEYQGKVLVGVTNANTGEPEYFDGKNLDEKCTPLRATCAIPLVFPAIKMKDGLYYDGGIADPIPIKKSISDGNDKNLIILTRPKEYRKTLNKSNVIAAKVLKKKFPKLVKPLLERHELYNETVKYCEELERKGKAIIIRPNHDEAIESFEKDINKIKAAYNCGYNKCLSRIEEIKNIIK